MRQVTRVHASGHTCACVRRVHASGHGVAIGASRLGFPATHAPLSQMMLKVSSAPASYLALKLPSLLDGSLMGGLPRIQLFKLSAGAWYECRAHAIIRPVKRRRAQIRIQGEWVYQPP